MKKAVYLVFMLSDLLYIRGVTGKHYNIHWLKIQELLGIKLTILSAVSCCTISYRKSRDTAKKATINKPQTPPLLEALPTHNRPRTLWLI
jgi:heterodisulfide reductase subunit B